MKFLTIGCMALSMLWSSSIGAQELSCDADDAWPIVSTVKKFKNIKKIQVKSLSRPSVYPISIVAVTGSVERERAGQVSIVGTGETLALNDVLRTGADGFVSLRLGDGTVNALPPNARVRFLQVNRYTARYELLNGRIESKVTKKPSARKNTFEIRLPTVSIGVRGTYFSVAYNPTDGSLKSEVKEGLIKAQRRNMCAPPLMIAAGQGARLDEAQWRVRSILPAPKLVDDSVAQRDAGLNFTIEPVSGASNYVAQVATDAAFLDVQKEFSSASPTIRLPEAKLDDGFYYVRLMAEDESGLRGYAQQYVFLRNYSGD